MPGLVWISVINARGSARYHQDEDCTSHKDTRRVPTLAEYARRAKVPACSRCVGKTPRLGALGAALQAAIDAEG